MAQSEFPKGTISTPDLARLIGVSGQTVRRLTDEGIIPKAGRAAYDPFVAVAAYCGHLRKQASGEVHGQSAPRLTTARARRAEAQAEITEIELAKVRGDLIDVQVMNTKLNEFTRTVHLMLRALGSRLGVSLGLDRAGIEKARDEIDRLWGDMVQAQIDNLEAGRGLKEPDDKAA